MKHNLSQTAEKVRQRHTSILRVVCILFVVGMLIAAPAAAQLSNVVVVDDFEDNDLNGWSNTEDYQIANTSNAPVIDGNYSMTRDPTGTPNFVTRKTVTADSYPTGSFKFVRFDPTAPDGDNFIQFRIVSGADDVVDIRTNDNGQLVARGSTTEVLGEVEQDVVYTVIFELNYSANSATVTMVGETEQYTATANFYNPVNQVDGIELNMRYQPASYDEMKFGASVESLIGGYDVKGTVTDQDDEPLSGVNVEITNATSGDAVFATTTNDKGAYSTELPNGTYTANFTKNGYTGVTETFTIDGEQVTVDAQLVEERLRLDTRPLFTPGSTHDYQVFFETGDGSGGLDDIDVTEEADVTSANASLLSVDEGQQTLTATSDEDVGAIVQVNFTYTDTEGETFNGTADIVVAAPTVENLAILPTGINRIQALFGDDTIFALLIAALLSVPASRFANAFGGLATAEMVIVVGWLGGYVGLGVAMLSIFMAMFVGLNLAENVNFTSVRNSGSGGGGGFGGFR